MVRATSADGLVIGVRRRRFAAGVPDGRLEDALVLRRRVVLQEDVFGAPEAPRGEGSDFGTFHGVWMLPSVCYLILRFREIERSPEDIGARKLVESNVRGESVGNKALRRPNMVKCGFSGCEMGAA